MIENNGPTFDPKEGLGAVPNNQDVNYLGMVKPMTADHFIGLASHLKEPSQKSLDRIKEHLKAGKPLGNPFLNVKWNKDNKNFDITSHDGRHRAISIKHMYGGHTIIPVHVFPGDGMRAKNLTPEMRNAPLVPQDEVKHRELMEESDKLHEQIKKLRAAQAPTPKGMSRSIPPLAPDLAEYILSLANKGQ